MFPRSSGRSGTWDVQLVFALWRQNLLSVVPRVNLVANLGFGPGATHTKQTSRLNGMGVNEMKFPLLHPSAVANQSADEWVQENVFEGGSKLERLFWTLRAPASHLDCAASAALADTIMDARIYKLGMAGLRWLISFEPGAATGSRSLLQRHRKLYAHLRAQQFDGVIDGGANVASSPRLCARPCRRLNSFASSQTKNVRPRYAVAAPYRVVEAALWHEAGN